MKNLSDIGKHYEIIQFEDTSWYYYQNKTPMFTFTNFLYEISNMLFSTQIKGEYVVEDLREILNKVQSIPLTKEEFINTELKHSRFDRSVICNSLYHSIFETVNKKIHKNTKVFFPSFRCEFSDSENPDDFKTLRREFIQTANWNRGKTPRIIMKYENYTSKSKLSIFTLVSYQDVLNEINSFYCGNKGYLILGNYNNDKLRIDSNRDVLINDIQYIKSDLLSLVWDFLTNGV